MYAIEDTIAKTDDRCSKEENGLDSVRLDLQKSTAEMDAEVAASKVGLETVERASCGSADVAEQLGTKRRR